MSQFNRKRPYNELLPLPPKVVLETPDIWKKTLSSGRALAQFKGSVTNLPNPNLFLDTIHLKEAKASSEIENIITTHDELYQSVVIEKNFENLETKEVLNYKEALWVGFNSLKKKSFITTSLCVEIVQCIKKNTSGVRTIPGTKLSNAKGQIIYTPPTGESIIREKLAQLENFINQESDLDPLIKMALMHYQFEAIHPFTDGNGRTGRILLLLYLKMSGLLDIPALYLSEYIIEHKTAYYKKLQNVTEKQAWESFILFMLDMIESTANKGLTLLQRIIKLMETSGKKIKSELPKIYSKELMERLFKLPYVKRQMLADAGLGTTKTVGNYLKALEDIGFLDSFKVGKEKLYRNHALMKVLETK